MFLQYVPDVIYEASETESGDLFENISVAMKKMNKGQIIEVISNKPSVRDFLITWCKSQKHNFLDRKDFGESSYFYIEKR